MFGFLISTIYLVEFRPFRLFDFEFRISISFYVYACYGSAYSSFCFVVVYVCVRWGFHKQNANEIKMKNIFKANGYCPLDENASLEVRMRAHELLVAVQNAESPEDVCEIERLLRNEVELAMRSQRFSSSTGEEVASTSLLKKQKHGQAKAEQQQEQEHEMSVSAEDVLCRLLTAPDSTTQNRRSPMHAAAAKTNSVSDRILLLFLRVCRSRPYELASSDWRVQTLIGVRDRLGRTPLFYALRSMKIVNVQILLENGGISLFFAKTKGF